MPHTNSYFYYECDHFNVWYHHLPMLLHFMQIKSTSIQFYCALLHVFMHNEQTTTKRIWMHRRAVMSSTSSGLGHIHIGKCKSMSSGKKERKWKIKFIMNMFVFSEFTFEMGFLVFSVTLSRIRIYLLPFLIWILKRCWCFCSCIAIYTYVLCPVFLFRHLPTICSLHLCDEIR